MNIKSIGEFGLIDKITAITQKSHSDTKDILISIGDDAAVYRCAGGKVIVNTTDAMSEGVHFNLSYMPFRSVGWKAAASNLSDIAAMGAEPFYAVVNIGIPDLWKVEDVEDIYRGMTDCMEDYGCRIVGGDTVRSMSSGFISVSVVGFANESAIAKRSSSQPGDIICMTGTAGGSRTGFEILEKSKKRSEFKESVEKFLWPVPRVKAAAALVRDFGVKCIIDISDGLGSELLHISQASGTGIKIFEDRIPVSKEACKWAYQNREDPLLYAISSGEEYELLFTLSPEKFKKLSQSDFMEKICSVHEIGVVLIDKKTVLLKKDNKIIPLSKMGWNQFSSDD